METWTWIVIAILAVVLLAALAYVAVARQRSAQLRERFGPEYDRTVESAESKKEAEGHLRDVAEQRDQIELAPLSETSRHEYASQWEAVQQQFVEEPMAAVAAADNLIVSVMAERGYPVDRFDERADLVAADHPEVVSQYRAAHAVREKSAAATTEDLRQAFVHYRSLFDEMLTERGGGRGRYRDDESRAERS